MAEADVTVNDFSAFLDMKMKDLWLIKSPERRLSI